MIPFELKQAMETGSAILFVGAGMGYNMLNEKGERLPNGTQLAKSLADNFVVPVDDSQYDLAAISQFVVTKYGGKTELTAYVKELLSLIEPDEYMQWIPTIKWKAIFTTNYDNGIEKAYDNCPSPAQNYVSITHVSGFYDNALKTDVPIIHLHGCIFDSKSSDIIITQQDYITYREQKRSLFDFLSINMASSCLLYTGYSNSDPNWSTVLNDIEQELLPSKPPQSFRIDPYPTEMASFILESRNIITIKKSFSEFVDEAKLLIEPQTISRASFKIYETSIPSAFLDSFDTSPAPTVRLFKAWEYVNEVTTAGTTAMVRDFVRGDKPSWSIIFNNKFFMRDMEDEIYDKIIDLVTSPVKTVHTCMLCAPAGYGTSTLIMTLAQRLVKDGAGMVFYFRNVKELLEGDVFFALKTNPSDCHIFIIDNASDYAYEIRKIIQHAKETKTRMVLVLGDRTNELNQANLRITTDTFIIQPLSDSEIERLIDYLAANNELNRLENLDRAHQIALIKMNYNRELLVAIREATEGKKFDAIIADEYYGIENLLSRTAYGIVSCFYQNTSLLRVELLSALLGVTLSDYYTKTNSYLEGIVMYECLDEDMGLYAARSRHRIISSIVWNNCITHAEKDMILHNALNSLNIAYRSDKLAFENFIKTDSIIDSLKSLESKINFFDRACRLAPDNPYVRQHYARMLVRSDKYDLALGIIDQAIEMDESIRILYHTKGYVLRHMAMATPNIEIARRIYGQSEEAYNYALSMNERDEYCYQGLAQLYLGWAKRCQDDSEREITLNKCEEIVDFGLRKAKDKETIWICIAKIDEFLGNSDDKIKSLQKAVKNSTTSNRAKFLLARAYRLRENYDECIPLLEEIVYNEPLDYRSAIEYALAILESESEESISKAIAVLQQSTLFGFTDSRFVSLLGGLLFLDKQFEKSKRVFNESKKHNFANSRSVMFKPEDVKLGQLYKAKVQYVAAGYSLLSVAGFPDIMCPGSKYNGIVLENKLEVQIRIEFTPSRPIALIKSK